MRGHACLRAWKDLGVACVDLLLPAVCPACRHAAGPLLCPACVASLPVIVQPCAWCGAAGARDGRPCPSCQDAGLPHVDRVQVALSYRGLTKEVIGDAKAAGRPAAVRALAALMPRLALDLGSDCMVAPVPPARGRRPGPHLATALARAVARRDGLRFRTLLRTTRLAAEQHILNQSQRRSNVAGLFVCRGEAPATVVLVDDLITSGATASSAAGALREAGARRIILLGLARTPRPGETEDDDG